MLFGIDEAAGFPRHDGADALDEQRDDGAMVRIGFSLDSSRLESFLRQVRRMVDVQSVESLGQPSIVRSVAA